MKANYKRNGIHYLKDNDKIKKVGEKLKESIDITRITTPMNELEITADGMEYLKDNSTMKKMSKFAHEVKDFFPRIML